MTDCLWILYPGSTGEYGGRAWASSAEEALEAIVTAHGAGGAEEAAVRAAVSPDDLVRASADEIAFTRNAAG